MKTVVVGTVLIGLLWFVSLLGLEAYVIAHPEQSQLTALLAELKTTGDSLGRFISPLLQLSLVLLILIGLARYFNIEIPRGLAGFQRGALSSMNTIQALIALIIVSAFCIAALAGLDGAGSLKDLALVVVGFYFGSRRRPQDEGADTIVPLAAPAAAIDAGGEAAHFKQSRDGDDHD